jgi:hypothetical protein
MILIRGSTRVADIYMTEFDRLFRHFYFRDVANDVASKRKKGEKPEKVFLDPDDRWTQSYFKPGGFKSRRREMFFSIPASNWTVNAATHSDDEPVRPPKKKKAAKAVAKKAKTKTAKKKTTKKTAKAASAKKAKTVKTKKVAKAKVKKAKTKTTKTKKAKTKTSKAKKSKAKSKR